MYIPVRHDFNAILLQADANYKCVSAASICAKVARDEITPNWVFPEEGYTPVNGKEWNSGYPSDPKCKAWMER